MKQIYLLLLGLVDYGQTISWADKDKATEMDAYKQYMMDKQDKQEETVDKKEDDSMSKIDKSTINLADEMDDEDGAHPEDTVRNAKPQARKRSKKAKKTVY